MIHNVSLKLNKQFIMHHKCHFEGLQFDVTVNIENVFKSIWNQISTFGPNGGKLGCPRHSKRTRESDSEDARPPRKAHRSNPSHITAIRKDTPEDKEALYLSHLATLRLPLPTEGKRHPNRKEVARAYREIMPEQKNEEDVRCVQEAFQSVWKKVNHYPEAAT